jgi:hypothetical protein
MLIKVLDDRNSVKEIAQLYQSVYAVEPRVQRMGSLEDLYSKMTSDFKENPTNPFT